MDLPLALNLPLGHRPCCVVGHLKRRGLGRICAPAATTAAGGDLLFSSHAYLGDVGRRPALRGTQVCRGRTRRAPKTSDRVRKPIHHRTCDGADADARNRRHAHSQIGRSLNFALSHGYANTTRWVRTGRWVPAGHGPENAGARRESGTLWPCRRCRKRREQVLPGEEVASSVSEAAASLFGCSGRAFRAANRLGVCAAPGQDARPRSPLVRWR